MQNARVRSICGTCVLAIDSRRAAPVDLPRQELAGTLGLDNILKIASVSDVNIASGTVLHVHLKVSIDLNILSKPSLTVAVEPPGGTVTRVQGIRELGTAVQ